MTLKTLPKFSGMESLEEHRIFSLYPDKFTEESKSSQIRKIWEFSGKWSREISLELRREGSESIKNPSKGLVVYLASDLEIDSWGSDKITEVLLSSLGKGKTPILICSDEIRLALGIHIGIKGLNEVPRYEGLEKIGLDEGKTF